MILKIKLYFKSPEMEITAHLEFYNQEIYPSNLMKNKDLSKLK